jgi:hypothetical protein
MDDGARIGGVDNMRLYLQRALVVANFPGDINQNIEFLLLEYVRFCFVVFYSFFCFFCFVFVCVFVFVLCFVLSLILFHFIL